MVLVLWHQGITIRTILSRRPSSGPALACTPLSPVFGSDAKPSAAPPPKCSCTAALPSILRRAWLQHECAGAHLANRRGSSAEHCPAARPLGSSRRLSAAHMRIASRWFRCNRRTSASILTRAGRALRIRRCRAALALCAAGLCALCPCAASLPINGAPFLGSPSTPRHGCQTQPPSSVSARSPEARPRMRVSSASRRPKQRGERRCLCTGRRELLAHRHVEP